MFGEMSTTFGEYLKAQIAARRKSEGRVWSQNELGRRAGISGGHVSMIIHGQMEPDASTLRKIARGLKVSVEEVYAAAGVLPPPEGELSGDVLALAREIEVLPDVARGLAIQAARATLNAMYALAGEGISAGYPVLNDNEYLRAIIRQFRDADPEGFAAFLDALADDEKTQGEPHTLGGAGQGS